MTNMDATTLWEDLQTSADRDEFSAAWLALQCSMIPGCLQGVLVFGDPKTGSYAPVASWPEQGPAERLADILNRTLSEREGMLVQLAPPEGQPGGGKPRYALAYPISVDESLFGTVAVEVAAASEDSLRGVMEGLQWGAVWLENRIRKEKGAEDGSTLRRLKAAVDILAVVLAEETFQAAATAFVTEVATRLGCDRVSLGLVRGHSVQVRAISHTAVVGRQMDLVQSIRAVMEEAVMQRSEVLYPAPPGAEATVVRDHERMARRHGAGAILTLPLYARERYYGVLTLERQGDRRFTNDDLTYMKSVAALTGPALENKYHNDRPIVFAVFDALKRQAVRVFGAGYAGRKIAVLAAAVVVGFFSFARDEYRLAADAVLEGSITRSVVIPIDGYIRESFVKAGDVVRKGQVLCGMDDRDLQLERRNWLSRKGQYQRQLQEAVAKHNRAEASIIDAQLDQAEAQIALVENKLAQIVIRAPLEGIIIRGDLSQRLGGAVTKGEEVFQIAPLDSYRLILKVDERRIADVAEGQKGILVLSSLSDKPFGFSVRKITPITTAEEGRNYFRVEADLDEVSPRLRPGMEGVGKISVDRRLLISIWTRDLVDWFRLRLWSWLP
ncbi:MAG: multidrug resistance protein MdtN [Syntrophaceae bacterium PtaU1.Bin231]|nr:MAG: multidrug resistance protein MdtN [Syntrophaceae bacterium PtaU1.Bin231]